MADERGAVSLKNYLVVLVLIALLMTGCSQIQGPTISANVDSDYVNTFRDLNLGVLFDFDFHSPHPDNNWVNIWVDRYSYGEKDPEPMIQLTFGNGPLTIEKSRVVFGIVNQDSDNALLFLQSSGFSTQLIQFENLFHKDFPRAWSYAIDGKKTKLHPEETNILAVVRQSSQTNFMEAIDLQDEAQIAKMLNEDSTVLVLNMKIGESITD